MFAILPAGLARHHDPKPAAALRTERFFGEPVISKIGFFNLDFNYLKNWMFRNEQFGFVHLKNWIFRNEQKNF